MTYALPTILEQAPATMDGLIVQDSAGNEFFARLWSVAGLTAGTYTRTLQSLPGSLLKAAWQFNRMGGCGAGVFEIQGGVADMDTAVQNEWELEIVRGGGALSTSVWYKGRIVRYSVAADKSGQRKTTVYTEGYASKLREIVINSQQIAAGQTVKQAVQTILDTYVTPATRIRYHADDIVGAYALVGALEFRDVDVLSTLHKLAMLEGSTEWGVTEGGTSTTAAPAFYFKAEATTTSETAVFILKNNVLEMSTDGTFQGAYNTVYVLGGVVSNVAITGSANDATAVNTYGARSIRVMWGALQNATDANRLATNYVNFYKDGAGAYCACLENPTTRLEPDRTNNNYGTGGANAIPATPKAQWWGDSAKLTQHWQTIAYTYEPGCAIRFKACGCGGLPPTTQETLTTRLFDSVDALANMVRHLATAGGAPTDAQYVTLAVHASLTAERVLTGTANQITVTDGGAGGNVTLSTPQDLHSGAEPSFAGMSFGTQEFNLAVQTPTQLNADANDYAFAGAATSTGSVYRLDAAGAARTITGIAGGVAGRILHLHNLGSAGISILFTNQDTASSAANRIITGAGTTATLGAGQWITLYYDGTSSRWRVL